MQPCDFKPDFTSLEVICGDCPDRKTLNPKWPLFLASANSVIPGQSFGVQTSINTQTQTVHRARNPTILSASRHTLSSFLALAGRSRPNHTSRSLIRAQRGQITTSSEAESFGKGRGLCLLWSYWNGSPVDTITYVKAEPSRTGPLNVAVEVGDQTYRQSIKFIVVSDRCECLVPHWAHNSCGN